MADDRSLIIPSVVDGLNQVQRTILLCALKNPNFQEVKEFIRYVSEHCTDRYREQDLVTTMTGMAQNYPGSNNINLLHPFGAGGRYMCTGLSSITRHLFHETDEPLLKSLNEDGKFRAPKWFMPIIPMVLVNGSAEGIGTKYNPLDIIANIRRQLNDEELVPMVPWYRWFDGIIQTTSATSYTTLGVVEGRKHASINRLFITELPIGKCAEEYEEFLKAAALSGEDKEPFIKDYIVHHHHYDGTVTFEVVMSSDQLDKAQKEGLHDKFKLTTNLNTNNMHLLDADGKEKTYNPEDILKEFFPLRLEYYEKRKLALHDLVRKALRRLECYVPMFNDLCEETIIVDDKEDEVLYAELKNKYSLPSMDASTCSIEYKDQQRAEWFARMEGLDDMLSDIPAEILWLLDLKSLEEQVKKHEQEDDDVERRTKWIPVQDKDEVKMRKKRIREQDEEDEAETRKRRTDGDEFRSSAVENIVSLVIGRF